MTDSTHAYLCNQLRAALSDAPGGEKAWVPLRRSTVLACIDALEGASSAVALMDELRSLLNRAQWGAQAEPEPRQEDASERPFARNRDEWNVLPLTLRTDLIRRAMEGERIGWLPDPRTWARHYPDAQAQANGAAHA